MSSDIVSKSEDAATSLREKANERLKVVADDALMLAMASNTAAEEVVDCWFRVSSYSTQV